MYLHVFSVDQRAGYSGMPTAEFGSKDGVWAEWGWDGERLTVTVDRYGFYPLFYCRIKNGVAVSDSIRELLKLGAESKMDDAAIAAFLRLGFFVGEDTPFESIRAFPPGGSLNWAVGEDLIVERRVIRRAMDDSLSYLEAVNEYVDRFRWAIQQILPEVSDRCALPLSGGRDSRHIAIELQRLGFRPGLVFSQSHYKNFNNEDVRIAKKLADAFGWKLALVPQGSDPVSAELEKNDIFEGLTDEHAWMLPSGRVLKSFQALTLFDGLAGDALSNALWVRPAWSALEERGRYAELIELLPHQNYGATEAALNALLDKRVLSRWSREVATERILSEYSRYLGSEVPILEFMFWNRTRREIAPFLIRYSAPARVLTPYLHYSIFDFLWSLPVRHQSTTHFHDDAIRCAGAEFAHVEFERKGVVDSDAKGFARMMLKQMASKKLFWAGSKYVNNPWLRTRMARGVLDRSFAESTGYWVKWVIWLFSLESLEETGTLKL